MKAIASLSVLALCAALSTPAVAAQNGAGCCGGELWNGWEPPAAGATSFEIDFAGDQTATIPTQVTNDPMINPFYALFLYNGSPVGTTTVTYDPVANVTRVIFSGGALPNPVPAGWPGPTHVVDGANTYHFGLNGGYGSGLTPSSMHWIFHGHVFPTSVLTASWAGTFQVNDTVKWAGFYTETAGAGGWQLIPYAAQEGAPVNIRITNGGTMPETVGNTGYELGLPTPTDVQCQNTPACQANKVALDQLSDEHYPIPGEPNSPFTPVKVDRTLQPGESVVLSLQ